MKEASSFPPLFIYHGTEDSAVDGTGARKFVEEIKRILDEDKLMVKLEPGGHGFDTSVVPEEPWMKEGLALITRKWLQ